MRHPETLKGLVLAPKLSGFTKCQHYSVVLNKVSAFHTTTALQFTNVLSLFYLAPFLSNNYIFSPNSNAVKWFIVQIEHNRIKILPLKMDSPFVITTILLAVVLERVV